MYWDDYYNYLFELLKEVISRQLVKSVEYDIILKSERLIQHVNSIVAAFNIVFDYEEDFPKIREDVERILKDKYHYVIKQDNPFVMKKVSDGNE